MISNLRKIGYSKLQDSPLMSLNKGWLGVNLFSDTGPPSPRFEFKV